MPAPRGTSAAVLAAWLAVTVFAMPWHLADEHHGGEELCGHACGGSAEGEPAESEPEHHVAQHTVDFLRAPSVPPALAPPPAGALPLPPEPEPAGVAAARDVPAPAAPPRLRHAGPRAPPSA